MAASVVKEVKSINGIPTLISRIHGPKFDITKCKNAVVIIPGNPGIIRFYDAYMASLFNKCDGKFPVFGIQHAGIQFDCTFVIVIIDKLIIPSNVSKPMH